MQMPRTGKAPEPPERTVPAPPGQGHHAPRTLAGATILQIVAALRDEPVARTALNVAQALLRSGARALVAAEAGPLAEELRSHGGEWIPLANDSISPLKLYRGARRLARLMASQWGAIVRAP